MLDNVIGLTIFCNIYILNNKYALAIVKLLMSVTTTTDAQYLCVGLLQFSVKRALIFLPSFILIIYIINIWWIS